MELNQIRFEETQADHRILIVHQNRFNSGHKKSKKHSLNIRLLFKYKFDLILWGHEHEPFDSLENFEDQIQIYQPGSSIPTSFKQSEGKQRKVGLMEFEKKKFTLRTIGLKRPRKMLIQKFMMDHIL